VQVLIVAHQNDAVAFRLRQELECRGAMVHYYNGPSAARLFTIHVGSHSTSVAPSLPMFVRPSAWCQQPADHADEQFLRAEAYATFWAAAALSPSLVINRPWPDGSVGRLTWGKLTAVLDSHPAGSDSEIYVSGREIFKADDSTWGEDWEFHVSRIAQFKSGTPLRARKVSPGTLYEIVTVVSERGFPATADPRTVEFQLVERSVALAEKAGVYFASITWAVDENGAAPVRLNPAPQQFELRYNWHQVADALCEGLM